MLSAPWLVSTEALPRFAYEGLANDLDALLEAQADPQRRHVLVVIFNKAWVDHLYNWVYSMVRNAGLSNYIVGTMDDASLALCKRLRLPCFDATEYAVEEDDPALRSAAGASTRKVSEAMSWIKPRLATAIIGRGFGFWMVDLDMSWNADPLPHVIQLQGGGGDASATTTNTYRHQIVHQCDAPARFSINSGFYDAVPALNTYLYFDSLMAFAPDENSDQTAMRLFGRYDHSYGVHNECLNKWLFDMKCNYKVPGSVRRQRNSETGKVEETFEWNLMDRNPANFKWVIHHATCLAGAMAKILYLRTMNAWFLDQLEEWSTTTKSDWCWISPNQENVVAGIIRVKEMGKIQFSSKYPPKGQTDETFLQKRH